MNGTRRGGFPTPRAQFINNGFGLGEFWGKRGLVVLAVPPKCAVRDAVELLVLVGNEPVANVASKSRSKDAR